MIFCKCKTQFWGGCLAGWVFMIMLGQWQGGAQTATAFVVADNDAFVRSSAPSNNYGAAGSLSVSGAGATNDLGEQNGLFDALMRFSLWNVVASFNDAFGAQNWVIIKARLNLTESAAPMNSIFNRGVGAFQILRLTADSWIEGTGKPNMPTTDGVAWQDLPGIINSNLDTSLGIFTNAGVDGSEVFTLALADRFVADVRQGGEVALRFTAVSASVGFTFNSRNFGNTNAQPVLEVTAAADPKPQIESIGIAGTNVLLRFQSVSNWSYALQGADRLPPQWSTLQTLPWQTTNGFGVFVDGATNRQRFYRLSVFQ